ncbi:MAG: hypothetical protein J4F41_10230, partial [Alphaproteobacteria bacterium]|nr:hypothetical protein [Alphaproteobacteria bacterium]
MARAAKSEVIEVDEHHPRLLGQNNFDLKHHGGIVSGLIDDRKNRLHHGFILSGPKGVGKATTAYRIAEHLF